MFFGIGKFAKTGGGAGGRPALDLNFLTGTLDSRLTFTRAATATDGLYTDATGSGFNSFAAGQPRISAANGLMIEQGATNFLLNSNAPVTQTTGSLSVATYTLWVIGTGSATPSAGTAVITGAAAATAGSPNVFQVTTAGTVTVTVAGSLTRFQLEGSSQPTSYVPTAGATAARNTELCSMPLGSWFIPGAGTVIGEVRQHVFSSGNSMAYAQIDDGTNNNKVTFDLAAGSLHGNTVVSNTGTPTASNTTNVASLGVVYRLGGAYGPSGHAAGMSGSVPGSRTAYPAGGLPGGMTTFRVGSMAALWWFNGYIRRVSYYPRDMYPADLIRLTT